ncbi:MAG: hypothetical protein ACLQEI_06835 [Terriglobales bacterium]
MTEATQFALDFDCKLPPSAQIGMAQADENAKEEWKRIIDGLILNVALAKREFTVDDVIAKFEKIQPPLPQTHKLCAIGPRMVRVSKELKYMTATNEWARSARPEKNGNLHRVWRSNLLEK